ncbi:hypothetical protein B0H14DRAFT_2618459 [Mycena olivaceomarginata]|nr:hypothetical protein B0H14DRAFT_2618459 [Mycena olivaceomarginata]
MSQTAEEIAAADAAATKKALADMSLNLATLTAEIVKRGATAEIVKRGASNALEALVGLPANPLAFPPARWCSRTRRTSRACSGRALSTPRATSRGVFAQFERNRRPRIERVRALAHGTGGAKGGTAAGWKYTLKKWGIAAYFAWNGYELRDERISGYDVTKQEMVWCSMDTHPPVARQRALLKSNESADSLPVTLCMNILLLTDTRMKKASKKVPEMQEPEGWVDAEEGEGVTGISGAEAEAKLDRLTRAEEKIWAVDVAEKKEDASPSIVTRSASNQAIKLINRLQTTEVRAGVQVNAARKEHGTTHSSMGLHTLALVCTEARVQHHIVPLSGRLQSNQGMVMWCERAVAAHDASEEGERGRGLGDIPFAIVGPYNDLDRS